MERFKNLLRKLVKRYLGIETRIIPIIQPIGFSDLLKNKVVLITGGSGGIGKVIAEKVILCGGKVILVGTNNKKLDSIVCKLGSNAKYIVINLANTNSIKEGINNAIKLFPEKRIDILVNSAGVHGDWNFYNMSEVEYDKVIDVNIKGTYFVTNLIAHHMIDCNIKGHILNVSSSSALRPAWTPYQISKWAINGMTKGFADLLLPHGIIVNGIAPGPTATEMVKDTSDKNIYYQNQPSKRYATPEEIANMAIYLISPLADFIVGDTIYITGGSGTISYHK